MKNLILIASTVLLTFSVLALPTGPSVTNAKVTELSAHRIDRLVALGKIDASFLKNLEKMEVTVVQNQAPVYFIARVSQTQPAQGAPLQLNISYDQDGKPLSFQIIAGGITGPDAGWTDKDAGSLAENALHYILENNSDAKVALFDKGISSFTLTKGTLNGETIARGQALSTLTTDKLNIYVKLDGTLISAEVIK